MPVKIEVDDTLEDLDAEDQAIAQINNNYGAIKQNNRSSSDDLSKKLADKLLHGWRMLEETCDGINHKISSLTSL